MKKQLRTNPALRLIALLLSLVLGTVGFWACFLTLSQWDTLWTSGNYYSSHNYYINLSYWADKVTYLAHLLQQRQDNGTLPYLEAQQLEELEESLSPQSTNFRYLLVDNNTGEVLSSNITGNTLEGQVYQIYTSSLDLSNSLALEYGVTDPLKVQDAFAQGEAQYQQYSNYLPAVAITALCTVTVCVLLTVFLCLGAGRRRGQEGVVLRLADRMPLDILAILSILVLCILGGAADSIFWVAYTQGVNAECIAGLGVITLGIWGYVLFILLTLTVRAKAGNPFSNTLIWRLCKLIGHGCRRAAGSLPFTWRVVVIFLLYLLGTVLTTLTIFLIPFYQGFVLYALCRWTIQWRRIRTATTAITGGSPDTRIDTRGMYPDLREHAHALNRLGEAIAAGVEERLKSERFRAELITNVSHDLKTPLTSILNYVDLLKKEPAGSPRSAEYLQVLERKSQRLKKLTEDLVEASKASTGTLPVHLERLGLVQLVRQSLGEFEEKFSAQSLTVIPTLPQDEIWVLADGRHLWRVVENLLSNCYKYAMEGTRIYLQVSRRGGCGVLTVKNISRQPLNLPAEQLMERFVRGDESRSTEGSGLGLSIARSLTQLQGGEFRLEIDGDLFKAIITLPLDSHQLTPEETPVTPA